MTKLDRCWKNCDRMWKWVAENWKTGMSIGELKRQWMKDHRYGHRIRYNCFFCQWAEERGERSFSTGTGCPGCPGIQVDAGFKCGDIRYDYCYKPKAFYRKISEMGAKRNKAKAGK